MSEVLKDENATTSPTSPTNPVAIQPAPDDRVAALEARAKDLEAKNALYVEAIRGLHAERAVADAGVTDPEILELLVERIKKSVDIDPASMKPKAMDFREKAMAIVTKMKGGAPAPVPAPAPAPVPAEKTVATPTPPVQSQGSTQMVTISPPSGTNPPLPKDPRARAAALFAKQLGQ